MYPYVANLGYVHGGGGTRHWQYLKNMTSGRLTPTYDRVVERRRAVALARHYREVEGLSIAQTAARLGRSRATVKAYFYDPSDANKRPRDSPHANALGLAVQHLR